MKFFKKEIKLKRQPKQKKELPKVEEPKELPKVIPEDDVHPEIVEASEMGLKSQLKNLNEKIDTITKRDIKKEHKHFKLPSKVTRQLKKLALKNKVMVLLLTRNRTLIPMVTQIVDGFININGVPHEASTDFIYLWKGKYPAIVVPEWDLSPIGTKDYYNAVEKKRIADPIAIAIRMMENKENIMKNKLQISPKMWVIIGLVVLAGFYIIFSGG